MKLVYEATVCTIAAAPDMTFRAQLPCDLEPDTIRYAVCRAFQKCPRLRREVTRLSWQLRLVKGGGRRCVRGSYLLPACWLGLPAGWARVFVAVDSGGVTVRRVELLRDKPARR